MAGETNGDDLTRLVSEFCELAKDFDADIVFVAAGADGHRTDPLSNLKWELSDYEAASSSLRTLLPDTPLLIGGAGGYQPHDVTPAVWSRVALTLVN